jgi:hypothetical protein
MANELGQKYPASFLTVQKKLAGARAAKISDSARGGAEISNAELHEPTARIRPPHETHHRPLHKKSHRHSPTSGAWGWLDRDTYTARFYAVKR